MILPRGVLVGDIGPAYSPLLTRLLPTLRQRFSTAPHFRYASCCYDLNHRPRQLPPLSATIRVRPTSPSCTVTSDEVMDADLQSHWKSSRNTTSRNDIPMSDAQAAHSSHTLLSQGWYKGSRLQYDHPDHLRIPDRKYYRQFVETPNMRGCSSLGSVHPRFRSMCCPSSHPFLQLLQMSSDYALN